MVICLERGADLHMAQLMPLPPTVSCSSKIQIGLPFWYRLTWVVPDKGLLSICMYVCFYGTECLDILLLNYSHSLCFVNPLSAHRMQQEVLHL